MEGVSLGAIAAVAYGLLALVGGGIGYAQARSQVSLISGGLSGALLLVGGWLWSRGILAGAALSLGVTVALVAVFIGRWRKTGKPMPALVMVVAGVVAAVLMVLSLG